MAGKVGEAFVEIVADYRAFATKAEKELNVLLKRLGAKADFGPMTEAAGDAGEESGREYSDEFDREVNRSTTKTRRRRTAERIGRDFTRDFSAGSEREAGGNRLTKLFAGIGGKASKGFGSLFGDLGSGAAGILGILGALGGLAGNFISVGASVAGSVAQLGLFLVLLPLVAGAVFTLGGALVSLSGLLLLLPAAVGILGAGMAVLQIAFMGFGEAISAIADGDVEKIDAALKKLSPSARSVAKEFQALFPELKKVQQIVQESFFGMLTGDLEKLGNNLLPKITPELRRVSSLFGSLASTFIEKLSSPQGIKFFKTVLDGVGDTILAVGPGLEALFGAIGRMVIASMPFAERLFEAIGDGLEQFAAFIDTKVADGSFEEFLENAMQTGEDFVGVIRSLLDLFGALFESTEEGGQTFLKDISKALDYLTAFFKSKDGKAALQFMIKLGLMFASALVDAARNAGRLYRALKSVKDAAVAAWEWLGKVSERGIGGALRNIDIPFFADGGLVTRPTLGMIGEAGPEVVVPLNNPRRAQQLMEENGLVPLAAGMGEGDTQVVVYLGTEQITDILDKRVQRGMRNQGRLLAQGTREG